MSLIISAVKERYQKTKSENILVMNKEKCYRKSLKGLYILH